MNSNTLIFENITVDSFQDIQRDHLKQTLTNENVSST